VKSICVYIPTHNRSGMLQRALNSVLAQTLPAAEIIVVDDGSSDDTPAVLALYQQQYPQIQVIRQPTPQGACVARNSAIFMARSEYITGLDDDDEFAPEHLATLSATFDSKYAFVSASLTEDTGSKRIVRNHDCGSHGLSTLLHYNKFTNQVFTLTSRLKAIKGFDADFPAMQDYDTWVRLVAQFGPALKIPAPTYIWHTGHEQNRISNSPVKRLAALQLFLHKHAAHLTAAQRNSLELMRMKMAGETLSFTRCLQLINTGNWRAAIALYLHTSANGIKQLIDLVRHR
jgi:glycosyltransferase involved in cell wall biosynthesis